MTDFQNNSIAPHYWKQQIFNKLVKVLSNVFMAYYISSFLLVLSPNVMKAVHTDGAPNICCASLSHFFCHKDSRRIHKAWRSFLLLSFTPSRNICHPPPREKYSANELYTPLSSKKCLIISYRKRVEKKTSFMMGKKGKWRPWMYARRSYVSEKTYL